VSTRSAQAPRGFGNIETWVFDLDNTLYPHHLNLWQQVMSAFAPMSRIF
jgi:FMN phosphatase YigB (HAD superfamily)